LRIEGVAEGKLAKPARAARRGALRRIDIALYLAQRDRPERDRTIGMKYPSWESFQP
jgi:hypothetical protein